MNKIEKIKETMPHTYNVLSAMCKFVSANIDDIDFENPFWFTTHTWTIYKQEAFRQWLVEELKNKELMFELTKRKLIALKRRNEIASSFILNYGWKCISE